jgi:hypothetical protein
VKTLRQVKGLSHFQLAGGMGVQPAYMLSMLLNFQPLAFKIIRARAMLSPTVLNSR